MLACKNINGIRVTLSAGTSVNYNYEDYRFRNDNDDDIQLLALILDNHFLVLFDYSLIPSELII